MDTRCRWSTRAIPGRRCPLCPAAAPRTYSDSLPRGDWTATVTHCGRICFKKRKVNLSQVFAGQHVGVKQVSDRIWLVTFMHDDLGYFDDESCRLEPIENPFGPKVTHVSEMKCYLCPPEWTVVSWLGVRDGIRNYLITAA